jgi:hypothetical protein
MMHVRPILSALSVLCLAATVGCKEDPPTPTLFDEAGAWTLTRYDLEGSGDVMPINNNLRENAFMLLFEPEVKVVTTAACVNPVEGEFTPANSSCLLAPSDTQWQCRCFAYAFEEDKMLWREFDAGTIPPEVTFEMMADGGNTPPAGGTAAGGTGDAGGTAGGGADAGAETGGTPAGADHQISLAEVADIAGSYTFLTLPLDVFGSNGSTSRFIFQTRSPLLFDRVYEDPDGRPGCTPCI